MNLQEKAVSHILANPNSNVSDIITAIHCGKSVAYAALSAFEKINELKSKHRILGIIGDTHLPFTHKDYLQFCRDTFYQYGVTDIYHAGDLVDHHANSRFISEPNALSSEAELDFAIQSIKPWISAFPDMKICRGNHDKIPKRQAKTLGISPRFIKSLSELYELPKTWIFDDHFEVDGMWLEHGEGSTGMYGCINTAMKYRMPYIQGHTHAYGGCLHRSGVKDNIWGLNVGCGLDSMAYASQYGVNFKNKPTLGCGIAVDGEYGFFVPMVA